MSTQLTAQPSLFGPRGQGLEDKFWEFHAAHPEVYRKLRDLALQMRRRGVQQYGIAGLFEVLRWRETLRTRDADGFKLNNSLRSFYARLLMEKEPELKGFFEVRTLRWQRYEVN